MAAPLRPLIYVAGPYSPKARWWPLSAFQRLRNVLRASKAAAACWRKGWAVVCPHANSFFPAVCAPDLSYQTWTEGDLALLRPCEAILYIAPSSGADAELAFAEIWGLTVYRSSEDVPDQTEDQP
jgi:hypothetical protein